MGVFARIFQNDMLDLKDVGYFSRVGAARCFCALFAQKPETARAGHHVALNGEAVKSNGCSIMEDIRSSIIQQVVGKLQGRADEDTINLVQDILTYI